MNVRYNRVELVDRKTIDSTQEVFTEEIDRAGNRALTMINLNCLHFCLLLRKSFHL